ncbi:hypothetical protein LOOC260_115000 [Paucilactobacillus hokkaidonensis JCM 18461]|uniref:Uncharacterized protein n=2 Tax=Paucilactobacillus hokkaidonensis TaxID=1193095 RepID=A0A0A1GVJ3_9LACO|nr:hypothetical protein [Paucilactobacillus hokkaidonensis]KRO07878.1 hypothetical protein IV59_GL001711 [Paucilactobacillus hokkaidonensis]BAP86010.1 hypothetical protein LOOC260_115000 [Paucilactobacillus hokkaidonensis JCM 18461]
MNKQPGYALLSVLIVMFLVTTIDLLRYQQYSQQRQIYTKLQNELLCQTMTNLGSNKPNSANHFNTGVVRVNEQGQAEVKLSSGFTYYVDQSVVGS